MQVAGHCRIAGQRLGQGGAQGVDDGEGEGWRPQSRRHPAGHHGVERIVIGMDAALFVVVIGLQRGARVRHVGDQPVRRADALGRQAITGLANGTTYTFTVAAVNSRGTGATTTTGSVVVGVPTAPGLVTATGGNVELLGLGTDGPPATKS